jgi:DNA polymerase III epsilon subunit-like protein
MLPHDVVLLDLEFGDVSILDVRAQVAPILEIGALRVRKSGEVVGSFERLVKPYGLVEDSVTLLVQNLTGINPQELEIAEPWHEVFEDFCDFAGQDCLASWGFDDSYLMRRWCGHSGAKWRISNNFLDMRTLFNVEYLDRFPDKSPIRGLSELCKRLHLEPPIHRAVEDCRRVLSALENLHGLSPNLPDSTEEDEPFRLYEV